ncbi:hypothetical protein NKH36_30945 [Mesorhizobium sp. M1312]|uniref:hypothetical protein n=1 Tax=unclassified Mesorhizobium TaxID=325217 RepID=UPI00333A2A32
MSVETAQRLGLHPITLTADSFQHDYIAAERVEAIHVDKANLDALIGECSRLLRPMNCRHHLRQGVGPCNKWTSSAGISIYQDRILHRLNDVATVL